MNEIEEWRDIEGFEGLYQVSNMGRVKSLKYDKERIMKPGSAGEGYKMVSLSFNGKQTKLYVHRLVGQTFITNPDNKPQINHINGKKTSNEVSNLEWATSSENHQHAFDTGLQLPTTPWLGKFGKAHNKSKKVEQRDLNGNLIKIWDGVREAARECGGFHTNISSCCKGKVQTCNGFKWNYHNELLNP